MHDNQIVQAPQEYTREQVDLIKATVAAGATDNELKLFLTVAKAHGLDPFTRQVHFIKRKRWDRAKGGYEEVGTIQTGIDGYRSIAARTGQLAGIDDASYEEAGGRPVKASVTVYRLAGGIRCPFTASARWSEYAQANKDGESMGLWQKMPYLMLAKCAEALALRKAFPAELGGIYTHEEMQQAEAEPLAVEAKAEPVPPPAPPKEGPKDPGSAERLMRIVQIMRVLKMDAAAVERVTGIPLAHSASAELLPKMEELLKKESGYAERT